MLNQKKLNNNKQDEYGGVLRPVPVQDMRKIRTNITGEEKYIGGNRGTATMGSES